MQEISTNVQSAIMIIILQAYANQLQIIRLPIQEAELLSLQQTARLHIMELKLTVKMAINAYLEQDNNVQLGLSALQPHRPILKQHVAMVKIAQLEHLSQRNVALVSIHSLQVALMFVQML